MNFTPYIWILVMIVMAIMEGVTAQLVSVWFVLGALVAAVVGFFVPSFTVQFAVFAVVSLLCLAVTRPIVKKAKQTKLVPTNADRNIGRIAVVTEEINNTLGTGRASIGGESWMARSSDDSVIPVGTEVKVESISGVKIMVKLEKARI